MEIIRTPEERFNNLPDYSFSPNYVEVEKGLRMHYVDEGPKDADPILMLHGEPSWSYLYRHMIPECANVGHRVIAPDLIGFGKSDKLGKQKDYTYAKHVQWVLTLIEELDLKNITLVCQDWGSLIGLRLATENTDRFARIVIGNGGLPSGHEKLPRALRIWRTFAKYSPIFPISKIINGACFKKLSPDELRAYDAPFGSKKEKAGSRVFPSLIPTTPSMAGSKENVAAWKVLEAWDKPFVTCFSNGDPITRGGDKMMQKRIPGTKGMPHVTLKGGHFLQEDSPEEFAAKVNEAIAITPLP